MKFKWILAISLAAALLVAACGDDDDSSDDGPSLRMGPGISIEEALASDSTGPLLVNGFIVVQGEEVRLCSALAESFPPQCGGDSLEVKGLDLSSLEGFRTEQGVTWSDEQRQILGEVEGEVFKISGTSL